MNKKLFIFIKKKIFFVKLGILGYERRELVANISFSENKGAVVFNDCIYAFSAKGLYKINFEKEDRNGV